MFIFRDNLNLFKILNKNENFSLFFAKIDFKDDEFNFQQPLPAEPGENHTEGRSSRSETPSFSTNPLKNMKNYIIRILPGNV